MCDCRKMKHTVCRTSKSHIDCKSVQNRIFRHNISRSDIVSHKLHNLHSRMFCKLKSRRIYRGNRSVSTKSHSQCFCQTIHAIGCIHSGTRTARRTCFIFKFINFFIVHFACRIRSDRFKHAWQTCLLPFYMSCKHRSSAHKDRRYIDTRSSHKKSRHIFITVRNHNKTVKLMCHCKRLCWICDKISRNKRIFHADMSHRNTVANSNSRNHNRCSSCHCNSHFYRFCNFIKIHMPGNNLIIRAYNSDQRSV